jgi:uncharacterized protein
MTFLPSLAGGVLIGLAAALMLLGAGRVAGVSGILDGALHDREPWRLAFLGGLLGGGALFWWIAPAQLGASPSSLPWLAAAGVLVGIGTRLGGGCTSGHGVCGVSRLSTRSIVATATFLATAMITVWVRG